MERRRFAATLVAGLGLALSVAPSANAASPIAGTYEGKAKFGSAELSVSAGLKGNLTYALRDRCGRSRGKLKVKGTVGERFTSARKRARGKAIERITVKGRFLGDGADARLTFARKVESERGQCRSKRQKLSLSLAEANELNPASDAGHYRGASGAGEEIGFDVAFDEATGRGTISNLAIEVATDCSWFGPSSEDPGIAGQVVRLAGLAGEVSRDGYVQVSLSPDEDSEYEIDGNLLNGQATLEAYVDGWFDLAGLPNPASDLLCGNFGESYRASRQG